MNRKKFSYFDKRDIKYRYVLFIHAYIHCREQNNRSNDYSKLAACFNDVVNLARFTAVDALHSTSMRSEKKMLNESVDRSYTIEFY